MADTTVSVKKDGTGDYTTIASAVAAADVTTGFYKIEIQDDGDYAENVNILCAGTPTINQYVWLTVASANRHSGVAGTGHARISGAGGWCVLSNEEYTRVEYLELSGALGCRWNESFGLLSRCILSNAATASPPSGTAMQVRNNSLSHSMDNCLIYNYSQGLQILQTTAGDFTQNIDFCTFDFYTSSVSTYGALAFTPLVTPRTATANLYNTILGRSTPGALTNVYSNYGADQTWNGSNNAWDVDTSRMVSNVNNLTSSQDIDRTVTTVTTTADAYIVTNLSPSSHDYLPVVATGAGSNLPLTNGTNRTGSEPDSRQNFSTDIRGAARPTTVGKIDIGAFQITTAAGFKYWNGSAFVDSTAVQYWNGSAFVDVNGIQYWNGSAWTDPS